MQVSDDTMYTMTQGARLHFIKFETKHIEATLTYIQNCLIGTKPEILGKRFDWFIDSELLGKKFD